MKGHHTHRHTSHSIDYYTYISGLKHWNSTGKILFSVGALLMVLFWDKTAVSVGTILYMAYMTVHFGRIPWREYLRMLRIPMAFILFGTLAIAVQVEAGFHIVLTAEQLREAFHVGIKALGAISAMYLLTLSTPMGEILAFFRKIHMPNLILELMHLIYRYIFVLSDIHRFQRDAAISRMGYCDLVTSWKSFAGSMANLLVLSLKRSEACFDAMEARGYDGELHFLEEKRPVSKAQVVTMLLYVVAMILCYFGVEAVRGMMV